MLIGAFAVLFFEDFLTFLPFIPEKSVPWLHAFPLLALDLL